MSEVCNLLSEIPTFYAGGSSGCSTPIKGHRVSDLFMSFLHCVTPAMGVISRRGIPSNLNIVHEWIPKTYSLQSILSCYVEFFAESDIHIYTFTHSHFYSHLYLGFVLKEIHIIRSVLYMYTYMCIWSNGGYFFSWFPYTICLDKATLSAALLIWYAQKI